MPRLSRLSRSVEGKVALITGAASGMGRATAHLFADEGAKVAVCDVNEDGVKQVVDEIDGAGGSARGWLLDVSDRSRVDTVVGEIVSAWGALDVLVNNAGISAPTAIGADDYEQAWDRTLAVNLSAHVYLIRAALPHLQRERAGRVINIASTEGVGASAFCSPYTSAKHGVIGLTRGLSVELGAQGVTVNCVCPGAIHTGMTAGIADADKTKFARRRIPMRRYGEPEEVAQATFNLALPASSYMNGAVVIVDGGLTVQNT